MPRRIMILAVAAVVALGVALGGAPAFAHDEYRIIGTVTIQQNSQLAVKSREGKMFSIKLDGETLVYRDNKKVAAAELRTGRFVVVDALGDSEADLVAVEVRIIAALPR